MSKLLSKDSFIIILIIFISFFFSVSYSLEQHAIEGGLVISGLVKYPEGYSVMKTAYFNGWTFLNQFAGLLLKLDLSSINASRVILFFSTFFYFTGIYLAVRSISSSSILGFFIALTVIIFRKNFGDIDYPTLIFSVHTNGMMSLAMATFVFGLIANGNLFLAGFFSIFLVSIHPVIGIWIVSVVLFSILVTKIFSRNFIINKKIFYGMLFSLVPVLLSFIFFYINTVEEIPSHYDKEMYITYMELWEAHRTNYGNASLLHYEYLAKSFFLVLTCILSLKYFTKKITPQCQLMLITVLISCLGSIIIYILYKFNPGLFPGLLTVIMPTRFTLMHSVIGIPIIISFLFLLIKQFLGKNKFKQVYAFIFILFSLFAYSISHYKNILDRTNQFISNLADKKEQDEKNIFWRNVKETKIEGFVLTSEETTYLTLRQGFKPILLNVDSIDIVPYMPFTVNKIKEIIEKVYDVPFDNPPIKNLAMIPNDVVKMSFEKKTYDRWQQIFNEFRISALIVPTNWKIDLKLNFKSSDYALYKLVE